VWHANPHLASFAGGGSSAKVPGVKVSDAVMALLSRRCLRSIAEPSRHP